MRGSIYIKSESNRRILGGFKMYKIKVLYKDKTRQDFNYESLQDLKRAEKSLIKLQDATIKMYATYEIIDNKEILL